jgi:hypothetical protein
MGAGILSCVAAAKSPLAGGAVTGADVGRMAAETLTPLVESGLESSNVQLDDKAHKWLESGISAGSTAAALWASFQLRQVFLTCSASAIGARLFTRSAADLFDSTPTPALPAALSVAAPTQWLSGVFKAQQPHPALRSALDAIPAELRGKASGQGGLTSAIETALMASSIALQLWPGRPPLTIPAPLALLLAPPLALEAWLRARTVAAAVAGARG